MKRFVNIWQKARHAGVAWTVRALWKRGLNRVTGHSALRGYVDRACRVDDACFLNAIDFGPCDRGDLAARFIEHPMGHHFLDDAPNSASIVREKFPNNVSRTIEIADAICRHEFEILGRQASFDGEIDWFWLPDTDARWPEQHVDDFPRSFYNRPDRPGDVKYPWELNRHQHFVTLAKAHLYTGDTKYTIELHQQAENWLEKNPFRIGINWYSTLEIAIRLISWTNAIAIMRSVSQPDTETVSLLLRGAYQHARYLSRTLTTHWLVANNHLVGETSGLFAFAAMFPEFHESERWRQRATNLLASALDQQVFPDGVNHEQATGYHRFVLDFIILVDRLGALNDVSLPDRLRSHLSAMLRYEAAFAPMNGLAPQIGDCDDGRGLALSETESVLDFRGWQPYGVVRLADESCARAAGTGSEESIWLLGSNDWRLFEAKDRGTASYESHAHRNGGHYVLRAGHKQEDAYVFVRCGPFGLGGAGSSVHSHADLMAPVIRWRGRELAVDSGTYGYLCDAAERDRLRSGEAHNTFLPEGADQGAMQSLWNWSTIPHADPVSWSVSETKTEFSGRVTSATGFRHDRTLTLQHAPLTLVIEDSLSYSEASKAVWRLHLAPGLDVEERAPGILHVFDDAGFAVAIEHEGFNRMCVRDTVFSPSYGRQQQNRCIELTSDENPASVRVVISDVDDPNTGQTKD